MSILIEDFSVGLEEYVSLSDLTSFSVNVTDSSYNISTSGTYFIVNDTPVATSFSGIVDGYYTYCLPPSISGSVTVTIHAENDNSESLEEDYVFMFGYKVESSNYVDWGPNKEITVWSTASNSVECPNTETFATYFRTRELYSYDLNACVYPSGKADLGASIAPQSKYLLPGYTYMVTISGIKDYSGNEMNAIEFSFTIEDT